MPAESKVYEYVANTVKVWDEARKWKKYTMDVFGDLVKVEEPKPAADTGHVGNYFTSYSYDVLGHLTRVEMTRGAATQVRTFNYEYQVDRPGAYLLSAQHPESGTVAYTYNPDGTLATKVDAKGQKTELVYDSNKRVTQVKKYPSVGAPEDEAARVELSYDTNPYEAGYSAYAAGRLTARQYKVNGLTFTEMYSYTRPGQVAKKKLRVGKYFEQPYPYPGSWAYGALEGQWEYNAEGKMTKVTYPTAAGGGGQSYVYGYDTMGRLKTMVDPADQFGGSIVADVTYGPAGEMLTMTGMVNESRGYNSRLQLTSFNGATYSYGPNNNGLIASETVSGETVVYQYDELNRLMKAETQGNVWGQQFTYDGFGNLTNKSVTKGSAPAMSISVDGSTNRVNGYPYDANGNQLWTNTQTLSYDYENRIAWVDNRNNTGRMYGYDPDNRRVYESQWNLVNGNTVYSQHVVHFWGVTGQRMASYGLSMDGGQPPYYGPSVTLTLSSERVYFGGRLLKGESGWTGEDRLGSVGQFYPYGEERVGNPKRFATYERDGGGLDYAVNRYYWVGTGRFMTPDPYMANSGGAGDVGDPGSWNRYSYVGGDPVNFFDPEGLKEIPTFRWECRGSSERPYCGHFFSGYVTIGEDPFSPPRLSARDRLKHARQVTTKQRREELKEVIRGLTDDCLAALTSLAASFNLSLSTATLEASAGKLEFFDVTEDEGLLSMQDIGFANSSTLHAYMHGVMEANPDYRIAALTLTRKVGDSITFTNNILLGPEMWNPDTNTGMLLLHEMMHIHLQADDQTIMGRLGTGAGAASVGFTQWLTDNCGKK
jgi:RHS repeat-associated protein